MPRPRTAVSGKSPVSALSNVLTFPPSEGARFVATPSSSQEQDMNENWEEDASVVVEYEEGGEEEAGRGRGKSREANLTALCLVCGGAAAAHQHYGAVCCYSCR